MEMRQLGKHGPQVSAIGLGCMPMSGTYGSVSDADGIATIHRALDVGINLLDTADVYGEGHNEQLVGRAIRDRRDRVVLATKFGILRPTPDGSGGFDGRREYVRAACERSLERLGVDHIDIYQQHRVDPRTPIEETIGALKELIDEGKIRYIGLSEALAPDLRRAAAVHPITSLQSEYSLLERSVEAEILSTCEELGIGFLPFSPLLRGLLAGSLTADTELEPDDYRSGDRFPRVGPEHREANAGLARVVSKVAAARGASPSQVALAWLLARRPWIVPIPGTKRSAYVEDNAGAAALQLAAEDIAALDALAASAQGDRYGTGAALPNWVSPPLDR
ncbi:MAG TPA: aldo/keto reductase [Solirubrobacteraceae bacterium]|jgi:aryl-alcohol dehydrogenase-like predicted oxidoreductase|nr:aldo/keto reductase [Solirubrobacteraceae bacterium]